MRSRAPAGSVRHCISVAKRGCSHAISRPTDGTCVSALRWWHTTSPRRSGLQAWPSARVLRNALVTACLRRPAGAGRRRRTASRSRARATPGRALLDRDPTWRDKYPVGASSNSVVTPYFSCCIAFLMLRKGALALARSRFGGEVGAPCGEDSGGLCVHEANHRSHMTNGGGRTENRFAWAPSPARCELAC